MKMVSKVTGKGPPLVLIPGGIAGWLSLEEKQDRLATTRKVIRLTAYQCAASIGTATRGT